MSDLHKEQADGSRGRQTVLGILGMHRSGTSLASLVVRKLGAATGKELMPANEYNQLGYGEDIHIVRLHDSLLAAIDRSWNTVRGTFPLPVDWTERPVFDEVREQLASYLRSEFARADGRIWAVKDPRMSMLLPLWFRLEHDLGFEFLPVLCIRSPDAVAGSVEKRDGIPADLTRLIWLQYNAAIVTQAGSRIKAVLNYDDWFSDPNKNLPRLLTVLGRDITDSERSEIFDDLVSSQLRHHAPVKSHGLHATWQALLEQWADEQKLPASLLQAAGTVQAFLEAFEPWRRAVTNQEYLTAMIDRREVERREVIALAERHLKAYRTVEAEFTAAREAIARLEKTRDELHAVADRNFEAYRMATAERDEALDTAKHIATERDDVLAIARRHLEAYRTAAHEHDDLSRRFALLLNRFEKFPFSLFMPSGVRKKAPSKKQTDDE